MRLLFLALLLALPAPAMAHRLKVFAALSGAEIGGHAFFVGGGWPQGVPYRIADATGRTLHEGLTDAEGAFRWPVPGSISGPGAYIVTVDAEDGHVASATLSAGGPADAAPPLPEAPARTDGDLDAAVSAAVRREMVPLLARIEEMDSRIRLTDVISGVFLILGAAGGLMWMAGRRREG